MRKALEPYPELTAALHECMQRVSESLTQVRLCRPVQALVMFGRCAHKH